MEEDIVKLAGLNFNKSPIFKNDCGRTLASHGCLYLLKGRGFFEDSNTPRTPITPGYVYYLFPGVWHCFDPDPGSVWTEYWVLFDGEKAGAAFGELIPPGPPVHYHGTSTALKEAFEGLAALRNCKTRYSREYSNFLLHSILMQIFKRYNKIAPEHGNELIERAKQAVHQSVKDKDPFDFRKFAESEKVGFETFRKDFARETGVSPNNYLISVKISRAMELLLDPSLTIKEIASRLGFRDQYYFSRLFKSREGISPELYRHGILSTKSRAEIEAESRQAILQGITPALGFSPPRGAKSAPRFP